MRPARCDRSREAISLRVDGMLSAFERALLDRHLRRCGACRSFAGAVAAQTSMLREAELDVPEHPVVVRAPRRRHVRRAAAGALTAAAAVAAAAVVALTPGGSDQTTGGAIRSSAPRVQTGAPVLMVVPAQPAPGLKDETVPRLAMRPASIADGPVHGLFNTPVRA